MKNLITLLVLVAITASCATKITNESYSEKEKYEANWSSLRKHNSPQWIDGLKFGIYFHYGAYIPKYTAKDFRFTQKDKTLYAICMEWPGESVAIKTLGGNGKLHPNTIKSVSMIGSNETVKWQHTPEALIVKMPKEKPCDFAYIIKIERK